MTLPPLHAQVSELARADGEPDTLCYRQAECAPCDASSAPARAGTRRPAARVRACSTRASWRRPHAAVAAAAAQRRERA